MRRGYRFAISAAAAAAIAVLAITPEHVWAAAPPLCLFRNLAGVECLGCGMTRALAAAAHGRWDAAFDHNTGVVLMAPLLVAAVLQGLRVRR